MLEKIRCFKINIVQFMFANNATVDPSGSFGMTIRTCLIGPAWFQY